MKKTLRLKKMSHGGRNLVILGAVSVVVTAVLTGVSLMIYHNSGDIYLDRSRPGYLPDEEESIEEEENQPEEEYNFATNGELTSEGLKVYLEKLEEEARAIDSYKKPFDAEVLSDENLGIVEKTEPEGAELSDGAPEKLEE